MANMKDKQLHLIIISVLLFLAFLFSVIAVATPGWHNLFTVSFLQEYERTKAGIVALWAVGCSVLILLGIICLCISAIILLARFFGQGRGKAILGGVLCIFTGCIYVVALGIFMAQYKPGTGVYGYSFGLLWTSVPICFAAGVFFILLKDDEFLKSELKYSAGEGSRMTDAQ
uniref:epithelial membrane protein 3-like n=1 Tax=Ciona intestinalis TaxID=7719 RepID=UPI0000523F62|nr:epithelial membrane protein 3-like [Ciona intestinalis]|eukprot:XP_002129175.1 epithelial membrane protein 3-like [Ciona intestinalis]